MVPGALGAPSGRPQEAKILQTPTEHQGVLPSHLFASDGLLRPQDGSKMAQEGPKRGPGGPQDGPKSAQERPKSAPRGPQEASFRAPRGVGQIGAVLFLIDGLQNGPREAQEGPQRAPRRPPESVQKAPRTRAPWDPQHASKRSPEAPKRPQGAIQLFRIYLADGQCMNLQWKRAKIIGKHAGRR